MSSELAINISFSSDVEGLLQNGQPLPRFLLYTGVCHSCPLLHIHHIFRPDPGVTFRGVKFPLRVGCHSLARPGLMTAKLYVSVAFGMAIV